MISPGVSGLQGFALLAHSTLNDEASVTAALRKCDYLKLPRIRYSSITRSLVRAPFKTDFLTTEVRKLEKTVELSANAGDGCL